MSVVAKPDTVPKKAKNKQTKTLPTSPSWFCFFSPFLRLRHQSLRTPVVFAARLAGVLGRSAVDLHRSLAPGGHAPLADSAAAGQAGHLAGGQHPVPEAHLGQLSNQGLGRVEAAAQGVLEIRRRKVWWTAKSRLENTRKRKFTPCIFQSFLSFLFFAAGLIYSVSANGASATRAL